MHYLWYDTETGGLNYKINPVLTLYFALCDKNQDIFAELDLKLKPDSMDGLIIEQGALDVNKINIDKHFADPETLTYSQAKVVILDFLHKHKIAGKRGKSFQPCGHNIPFDDDFIIHHLLGDEWRKNVHHRKLDTSSLTSGFVDMGLFPENVGSLTSLVEHFNVPRDEAHTAKGDVRMNIKVYKSMKKMISGLKANVSSVDKNLLSIIEA